LNRIISSDWAAIPCGRTVPEAAISSNINEPAKVILNPIGMARPPSFRIAGQYYFGFHNPEISCILPAMNKSKLQAWWSHRQGLDGRFIGKSAADVLEQTGWARSVGGSGPYLTLFARSGIGRRAADSAVAGLEIHELPSARGCTYVLPAVDFALGLKVGQGFSDEAAMKVARKLGVTDAEVDRLSTAVMSALKTGPMDPEQLREGVGGAVRNLGEEGKKKGLTTTLPLALGNLQATGHIRRVPINGRLDQQRYRYVAWRPNPLDKFKLSAEEACTELARRFFHWIGPATLAEFQWFSGLGVKAAKSAVEPLGLQPLEPEDLRLMFPEDRDALLAFKVPRQPQFSLISSLDGISQLRRDVRGLLAPEDSKTNVFSQETGSISDLPSHAILDRGRIVGLWEYDVERSSIAWMSFVPSGKPLQQAVERTERFIREDLGDARSFSLDSPKSRAPRIQALRRHATH
jgi:hypothetical protein